MVRHITACHDHRGCCHLINILGMWQQHCWKPEKVKSTAMALLQYPAEKIVINQNCIRTIPARMQFYLEDCQLPQHLSNSGLQK